MGALTRFELQNWMRDYIQNMPQESIDRVSNILLGQIIEDWVELQVRKGK